MSQLSGKGPFPYYVEAAKAMMADADGEDQEWFDKQVDKAFARMG